MGLEALAQMEYPGRFIILGRTEDGANNVAVYGLTGRSPSSQARRLVLDTGDSEETYVKVEPTDEETLKKGNPDLLIYPAMVLHKFGIAVSNGKQTEGVAWGLRPGDQIHALNQGHKDWSYEPDKPNFTPRISAVLHSREVESSAFGIIKKLGEGTVPFRSYFEVPLISGRGHLIATYTGENRDPLPSFKGEPIVSRLSGTYIEETVKSVYGSLSEKFRVSVAVVYWNLRDSSKKLAIMNKHGGLSLHE
ncbi:MAG TPA: IMP cyclohydrolase [Candidatus Nanoarchaeia archaeon]|nr:IMP cyclohydrolase [Candidatus Nanoarchaeia archaeon]